MGSADQNLLSIDVGNRRVGIAVSDRGTAFAIPLETHDRRHSIGRVVELVRIRKVDIIVVGWPITLDGRATAATQRVATYQAQLSRALLEVNLVASIVRQDERLTTVAAEHKLNEAEVFGKRRKLVVDQVAAVEILQSYLKQNL